jgi:hypothetical protein
MKQLAQRYIPEDSTLVREQFIIIQFIINPLEPSGYYMYHQP